MSTFNVKKSACENIRTQLSVGTKTVDFSDLPNISGGDTVVFMDIPAKSAVDRLVVNVETAATSGISGQMYIASATEGSVIDLETTGATFISADEFELAATTISMLTSGSGAIEAGVVTVQAIYSIVDE